MTLDDLKDQFREQFSTLWGRIQESSTYNDLNEKFQALPAVGQRAVIFGAGFLVALLVLAIPYSYISSAGDSIDDFDTNRELLSQLLRVGGAAQMPSPLPPALPSGQMAAEATSLLKEFHLLDNQIVDVRGLDVERPAGNLAPAAIAQTGIAVSLRKINLNQMLDIGYRLEAMSSGVKMTSLDIAANTEDNHYYDVTYQLVDFSLATSTGETETHERPRGGKNGGRGNERGGGK